MWGYFAKPREEPTPEGYTHDWTAFVKGETRADGHDVDIMHVVKKVVFQLHKDFEPNATRGIVVPTACMVQNNNYIITLLTVYTLIPLILLNFFRAYIKG